MQSARIEAIRRGHQALRLSRSIHPFSASAFTLACAICQSAHAQTAPPATRKPAQLPEVVVEGKSETPSKGDLSPLPESQPVSTTTVTRESIAKQSVTTYGDLVRGLTGVNVNDFGQGGVGYGISLRGFPDGDHGRDVAYAFDGVSFNEPSALHINGYADLNPIIPETIEGITVHRGPFNPRFGNYALGGSIDFVSVRTLPTGLHLSGGSDNYLRALATYGFNLNELDGFLTFEARDTGGYRKNSQLRALNTFDKITFPMAGGTGALRVSYYQADYEAPGYLDRALVRSGALSPRAVINPDDGGTKKAAEIAFNYRKGELENEFSVNAYGHFDDFERFATFNLSPDPTGQRLQRDRRFDFGTAADKFKLIELPGDMQMSLLGGVGLRSDIARADEIRGINPGAGTKTVDVDFSQHNPFAFAQVDFKPLNWLKLTGGARYDHFFYDIDDNGNSTSYSPDHGAFSPKGGLTVSPTKWLDLFANVGKGFRAPSAVDELTSTRNVGVSRQLSEEVGINLHDPSGRWSFLGTVYHSELDRELAPNAPGTPPTVLGESRREGFEVELRWRAYRKAAREVTLLASYTAVRTDLLERGGEVPNVADYIVTLGTESDLLWLGDNSPHRLTLGAYGQLIGPKAVTPDRSVETRDYSRISAKLAYTNQKWHGSGAFLSLVAYPGSRLEETAFDFGGGAVGISPQAPVSVQGGINILF